MGVDPNRHIVLIVQGSERASLCWVVVAGVSVEVKRRGKLCYVCNPPTPTAPTPTPSVYFPLKERKKDRKKKALLRVANMKRERVYSKMIRARVLVSVGAGGRWVRRGLRVGVNLLCAGCRVVAEQAAKVTPASQLSGRYSSSLLLFVLEGIAVPPATSYSCCSSSSLSPAPSCLEKSAVSE